MHDLLPGDPGNLGHPENPDDPRGPGDYQGLLELIEGLRTEDWALAEQGSLAHSSRYQLEFRHHLGHGHEHPRGR